MSSETMRTDNPKRLADVMMSALLLLRMTNPTISRSSYGDAQTIFGSYHPKLWDSKDVEALLNINGIIADGLHNLPSAMIGQEPNINDQIERLAATLDQAVIPTSVYLMPIWTQFCRSLAGRTLGKPAFDEIGERRWARFGF